MSRNLIASVLAFGSCFATVAAAHPCTSPEEFARNMALVRSTGVSYEEYVRVEGKAPDRMTAQIERAIFKAPFDPNAPISKSIRYFVKIIDKHCLQ